MGLFGRRKPSPAPAHAAPPPGRPLPPPTFVPPSRDGFEAGGERLAWGTTAQDLRASLERRGRLHPEPAPLSVLGLCEGAHGFPALSFESAAAQRDDRPVTSLTYHLAPSDPRAEVPDPAWWARAIRDVLGEPAQMQGLEPDEDPPGADGVQLWAQWVAPPFEVGLSVFGGRREEPSGISVAYLYVTWTDEVAAAQPYLAGLEAEQAQLETLARDAADWQVFTLRRPSPGASGEADGEEPEDPAAALRRRALSGDRLYDTPVPWQVRLSDTQVAHWKSADGNTWGIATRRQAVFFATGDRDLEVTLNCVEAGRFDGYVELSVGNLRLADDEPSPSLEKLADWIGRQLGRPIEKNRSRNDY